MRLFALPTVEETWKNSAASCGIVTFRCSVKCCSGIPCRVMAEWTSDSHAGAGARDPPDNLDNCLLPAQESPGDALLCKFPIFRNFARREPVVCRKAPNLQKNSIFRRVCSSQT